MLDRAVEQGRGGNLQIWYLYWFNSWLRFMYSVKILLSGLNGRLTGWSVAGGLIKVTLFGSSGSLSLFLSKKKRRSWPVLALVAATEVLLSFGRVLPRFAGCLVSHVISRFGALRSLAVWGAIIINSRHAQRISLSIFPLVSYLGLYIVEMNALLF